MIKQGILKVTIEGEENESQDNYRFTLARSSFCRYWNSSQYCFVFPQDLVTWEPFIFFIIPAILLGIFSVLSVKLSTRNIRIVSLLFLLVLLSLIIARPYVWLPGVIALFGGIMLFLVTSGDDISNTEGKRAA